MLDRLRHPARSIQDGAEIIVRLRVVGFEPQRLLITPDRLRRPADFGQGVAQITADIGKIGIDSQRPLIERNGFGGAPRPQQDISKTILGAGIVGAFGHRIGPDFQGTAIIGVPTERQHPKHDGKNGRDEETSSADEAVQSNDCQRDHRGERQVHPMLGERLRRQWPYARTRGENGEKPDPGKSPDRPAP